MVFLKFLACPLLKEGLITFSAVLKFLVGWYACAVTFTLGGTIFAQLACPLNDVIFC